MPHCQCGRREIVPNFDRQAQQAHVIGDGRPVPAHRARDRFLRELQLIAQASLGLRFLDRVEVFALDVLDERHLEQSIVRNIAEHHGNLQEAGALRRAPPALAGDDLDSPVDPSDDDRLDDTV